MKKIEGFPGTSARRIESLHSVPPREYEFVRRRSGNRGGGALDFADIRMRRLGLHGLLRKCERDGWLGFNRLFESNSWGRDWSNYSKTANKFPDVVNLDARACHPVAADSVMASEKFGQRQCRFGAAKSLKCEMLLSAFCG